MRLAVCARCGEAVLFTGARLSESLGCAGTTSISSAARRGCRTPRPAPRRCTCRRQRWPCWRRCRASTATRSSSSAKMEAPRWSTSKSLGGAIRAAATCRTCGYTICAMPSPCGGAERRQPAGDWQAAWPCAGCYHWKYAHLAADPVKAAAASISGTLAAALGGSSSAWARWCPMPAAAEPPTPAGGGATPKAFIRVMSAEDVALALTKLEEAARLFQAGHDNGRAGADIALQGGPNCPETCARPGGRRSSSSAHT